MNKAITVEQLLNACARQVDLGNGDKRILISTDDEGNGFHELFFGFTLPETLTMDAYELPYGVDPEQMDEYMLLG